MKLWKIILCTSAMLLASLTSSAQSITYSYDAAGNRVSRGLTVSRMRKQERKTLNLADGNDLEGRAPDRRPLRSQSIRSFLYIG